jgi:hypothetical protein
VDQAVTASARATSVINQDRLWIISIGVTLALILLINPVGYLGGGRDDWQYLNAARCWVENGPCLPKDHWQGRWPVIAPIAAMIWVFGESRLTIGLPSLIYAIGCIALVARLGNRVATPPTGYVAALILLVVPIFGIELLGPNAEHPEFFFLLASANLVLEYAKRNSASLAFAGGLAWSLAFQVRETAIIGLPLLAYAIWTLGRRNLAALFVTVFGASLPLIIEGVMFMTEVGNPLWRRQLALAHTQTISSELLGPIDHSRSPFFNSNYIANWKHEPGIHLHWAIDGLVNLLVNAKAGVGLMLSLILSVMFWGKLSIQDRRVVGWSMLAALYWACSLIYVLAIDPKARMMIVPVGLTSLALAICLLRLMEWGSVLLASVALGISWLAGMTIIIIHQQIRTSEPRAAQWATRFPHLIEIDPNTARHLALAPAAQEFAPLSGNRPMLAVKLDMSCEEWASNYLPGRLRLIDRSALGLVDNLVPGQRGDLCLFAYRIPVAPAEIMDAKSKARVFVESSGAIG